MNYLIDTNICIYILNRKPKSVLDRFESFNTEKIGISSITVAELEFGAKKSKRRKENLERLELFLFPFEILPFNGKSAKIYGDIRSKLELKGHVIGQLDMLIAAQALENNLVLVTNNQKEFSRISNLKLENWI
ncbi:MAG: type II toxin-antitoxin system VapC family toxin [Calditrichaeota bacterium]|nr:type II toxin-antitoxin system VapC family toxin [Anaerolineae bacterium]MBT7618780.1 type II toxin-antitoxin system VapC family toxin [Calditrichota bacterium]